MAGEYLVYNEEERKSWEVIIVLPGVEIIPEYTFFGCNNVETVIMAETVQRIEEKAFWGCKSLEFVNFSRNLEFIGEWAFCGGESLTSIFILPSCREIDRYVFQGCEKLIILSVPQTTDLGHNVIGKTALIRASHFELNGWGQSSHEINNEVNDWIKTLNQNVEFALHRECASHEPSEDNIHEIIKHQGLPLIHVKNQIGITAFEYLEKNPYADIDEQKLINRLVLDLMGEIIT